LSTKRKKETNNYKIEEL